MKAACFLFYLQYHKYTVVVTDCGNICVVRFMISSDTKVVPSCVLVFVVCLVKLDSKLTYVIGNIYLEPLVSGGFSYPVLVLILFQLISFGLSGVSVTSCIDIDMIKLCLSQQSEESLPRPQSHLIQRQQCCQFSLCSLHYLCSADLLLSHPFPLVSLQ